MKQTKGAIGNLLNRYRAVLKKCHLLNTFGSLAVASMLVMGGAGVAQANTKYPLNGVAHNVTITSETELAFEPVETGVNVESGSQDIIGGVYLLQGTLQGQNVPEENISLAGTNITLRGNGTETVYKGELIGGSLVEDKTGATLETAYVGTTNIIIESTAAIGGQDGTTNDTTNGKYNNVIGGGKVNGTGISNVGTVYLTIYGKVDGTVIAGGNAKRAASKETTAENWESTTGGPVSSASVETTNVTIGGENASARGIIGGGVSDIYGNNLVAGDVKTHVGTTNITIEKGATVTTILAPSSNQDYVISASVLGGGLASKQGAGTDTPSANAIATAGDTNILIKGGTIENKVVAGGAAINGGQVEVANTSLKMTDGEVQSDLVGGNLIDGQGDGQLQDGKLVDNISTDFTKNFANQSNVTGSTNIEFTGGTVTGDIMGGSYVRNAEATSNVLGDTHVLVSGTVEQDQDQNWVENVLGGGKAMTYTADDKATANVLGTANVTVRGGADVQVGLVAGGGMARLMNNGGDATATVNVTKVTVAGGTVAGVAGGGIAENRASSSNSSTSNATVTKSQLDITEGTINKVKYGNVNDGKEGSPTSNIAVVGGGIAWSLNADTNASAKATVDLNFPSCTTQFPPCLPPHNRSLYNIL